jgi:hypothetical protein
VKTTGIRIAKRVKEFEAKEPMSITAVSINAIEEETFYTSKFWHKVQRMLLIYYHYDSLQTVPAAEYAKFSIKGYQFFSFDSADIVTLESDWQLVHDFIERINTEYTGEDRAAQYPRLSSELRKDLMMIDTAPKYPHPPRFRLKRATVSNIVQEHFGGKLEQLPQAFHSFSELDQRLHVLTDNYSGKSVKELMKILDIQIKLGKTGDVAKNVTEQIITRMFNAKSKKISNIEDFTKIGLAAKTLTQTASGGRTEDTKLFPIDFTEWLDNNIKFEDTAIYSYFNEQQFLFIVFEEAYKDSKLIENKFIGFKRINFSEIFINNKVHQLWENTRNLILNNELVETLEFKKDGTPYMNKTGVQKSSINFDKSKDHELFVRGTGNDSTDKPLLVNGIAMYYQDAWIKGKSLVHRLNEVTFI